MSNIKIFKLSIGKQHFSNDDFLLLKQQNLVCVSPNTGKGEGPAFVNAQKGDVFYACRSNDSIEFIGMFIDSRPMWSTLEGKIDDEWVDREYKILFKAKNKTSFERGLNIKMMPRFQSTFTLIPNHDFKDFEKNILQPVFQISLSELEAQHEKELVQLTKAMEHYSGIQKYFFELKKSDDLLFGVINKIEALELRKIEYSYSLRGDVTRQPVVRLRYDLLRELIKGNSLDKAVIDEIKSIISSEFEKNVFKSWSDPYRILYTFLYDAYKCDLTDYFKNFAKKIQKELGIEDKTKIKLVHLDGAQNQGDNRIWFAIYNNAFKSQKYAKQLFFHVRNGFEYGLLDQQNGENNDLKETQRFDYKDLIKTFSKHIKTILNDNSMEKAKIEEYIEILEYKKQIILQGPPGTGKTYNAKKIAEQMVGENNDDQIKIIQFHPSYTYEDFVRGITAKSEGEHIVYETENKTLSSFAEKANNNLKVSKKDISDISKEQHIEKLFLQFVEKIQDEIETNESFEITTSVSVQMVEEDAFRYTGNWKSSQRMKFKDLVIAQISGVSTRQELKALEGISGLAKQHASYYIKVLNKFQEDYKEALNESISTEIEKPKIKPYVLIIDEINRANLPSVLGELIYALEYRNESVQSMYAIDGDNSITIPENLYIIGTMNTADRSVGHIDYAIKRRFAFVDVLPNEEVINNDRAKELFRLVASLFVKDGDIKKVNSDFLATDFDCKDVQLGHSYFLLKEGTEEEQKLELKMRLDYEIIPILNEYVKDGLLKESAKSIIEEIANFGK